MDTLDHNALLCSIPRLLRLLAWELTPMEEGDHILNI
jgi:hypothetical protein